MFHTRVSRSKDLIIQHHGVTGERLKREGPNELAGGSRHHRDHLGSGFGELTKHLYGLERSDAAGDTEDNRLTVKRVRIDHESPIQLGEDRVATVGPFDAAAIGDDNCLELLRG
jgi:hypothetical protein